MGVKSARSQTLFQGAAQADAAAKREEDIFAREQAAANIKSMLGDRDLAYGATGYQQYTGSAAPQIGSTPAQVSGGGGGAVSGFLTGDLVGVGDLGKLSKKQRKIYGKGEEGRLAAAEAGVYGKKTRLAEGVDPGSIFKRRSPSQYALTMAKGKKKKGKLAQQAGYGVDPEALAEQVHSTAEFRIMNKLMVEAEDFMNREGPLYEQAVHAQIGPIMEGSARAMEQAMSQINMDFARGGTARRNALRDTIAMQATIQNNAQLVSQLSGAHFKLDSWARENAASTVHTADAWAKNVAGVRQEFASSMQALSNYMGQVALPAIGAARDAYQSMSDHLGDNKTQWGSIALGAATSIAAPFLG
jgi:hypothetical protein